MKINMSRLQQVDKNNLGEGEIFNKFLHSRMIRNNKNVILAVTGSTGSGKTYVCLRVAELWYQYHFKEKFPVGNVCFSVDDVMRLLDKGKLKRGSLIILEEAGVNMGSLDFQSKLSKIFSYVLQSFRSMNVGLIMNLPVLSMLNKQARQLLHCNFITMGVDYETKISRIKPFFHQVNVQSGKIYPKYMRVRVGRNKTPVKRFVYSIPSKELAEVYELKKEEFISQLITTSMEKIDENNKSKKQKKELNEDELDAVAIKCNYSVKKMAETLHCSERMAHRWLIRVRMRDIAREMKKSKL